MSVMSDEERARNAVTTALYSRGHWLANGGPLEVAIAEALASVRAEERARDGSWERLSRETAEGLKSALDAIAAKDAEIAALRNALEKARPFVELQIGAPAAGKIFLESVSLLPVIDAALEMSGCP